MPEPNVDARELLIESRSRRFGAIVLLHFEERSEGLGVTASSRTAIPIIFSIILALITVTTASTLKPFVYL